MLKLNECIWCHLILIVVVVDGGLVCFCFKQKNNDGQAMLASTMIPQPHTMTNAPLEDDVNMSFGRCFHILTILVHFMHLFDLLDILHY